MAKINPKYKGVTSVGAGAISQQESRPKPTLEGISEYEYVTLANILPFKFIGKVAQSRPVANAPVRIVNGAEKGVDEDTLRAAGLDLRNPDNVTQEHVTIEIPVEPGQSINLRGDEAQVIIRQLVNEIMAYEGNTLRQGSPAYRKEVEGRIVQRVRSIDDLMGANVAAEQTTTVPLTTSDTAFPGLVQGA